MKIYLLRHTSLDVDQNTFYGQTDLDVSVTFQEEIDVIKTKLEKENLNLEEIKCYSSPLKRCTKLAKQITHNFEIDGRLKEMNLGDWEMKKMSSIPASLLSEWENNLLNFKIPNGESNQEFLSRLESFLEDLLKIRRDSLIICHAGSINGMISILTNEPFDKLVKNYWEKIKHGSISLIEVKNNNRFIKYLGK